MCLTVADAAARLRRSRRRVNQECAALFGPGGWQRFLTDDQFERLQQRFGQPGRWKSFSPNRDNAASGGHN